MISGNDAEQRLKDLDEEGVWAEVIYPALGIWAFNIRTLKWRASVSGHERVRAATSSRSRRASCNCASIPLVDVDDAVAEITRVPTTGS